MYCSPFIFMNVHILHCLFIYIKSIKSNKIITWTLLTGVCSGLPYGRLGEHSRRGPSTMSTHRLSGIPRGSPGFKSRNLLRRLLLWLYYAYFCLLLCVVFYSLNKNDFFGLSFITLLFGLFFKYTIRVKLWYIFMSQRFVIFLLNSYEHG